MNAPVLTAILLIAPVCSFAQTGQDPVAPRERVARAASSNPRDVPAQLAYAEDLERYGDPGAREAYARTLSAAQTAGDKDRAAVACLRMAQLDLLAGDREAASRDAAAYQTATGKTIAFGDPAAQKAWAESTIPGPLRSFARMAAISPDSRPTEILPALAHNVITNGYEASHGNEALEQTEYLKLVHRYLSQARELDKLAGEQTRDTSRRLRCAECGRTVARVGFPHARRMRVGSGAGDGKRGARVSDHGFGFPHQSIGRSAAHESPLPL